MAGVAVAGMVALFAVVAVWLGMTWMRWRLARRRPRWSPSIEELLIDSLAPIEPRILYERLAATLAQSVAPELVIIYTAGLERGLESWSMVFPLSQPLLPDSPGARCLSLARRAQAMIGPRHELRDEQDGPVDIGDFFEEHGVDWLLPIRTGIDEAMVVGMRLRRAAREPIPRLLESWRVCASAVMQAQALRHGDAAQRALANEAEMAKFLEAAALSPVESHGQALEWAVRFYGSGDRPYFLTTYAPSPSKTLVVFGRAIASGVAASLLNVAIKSFCDVIVKVIGADISLPDLTDRLNRFLWQPRKPVGAYCHLLLVDRSAARLELASAGSSTLTRVHSEPGKKRRIGRVSCQGLPLGSSIEGTWKMTESPLEPGDGFLVWTEWTAVKETSGLRFSPLLERATITAEALIDDALGAGVDTPCVLAVAVR